MVANQRRQISSPIDVDSRSGPARYSWKFMHLPTTTHRRMTAREYFAMPEGPPYFQLVHGELFMSPSPIRQHQWISVRLASRIDEYLRAHPIGEVYTAPSDVEIDEENIFQPDIYFVSRERLGILNRQGAKGAPDLVIEILSPSTARLDREHKRAVYLHAGVRELWFVNVGKLQVEVYLRDHGSEHPAMILLTGDSLTTPLLPGLTIQVAEALGGGE